MKTVTAYARYVGKNADLPEPLRGHFLHTVEAGICNSLRYVAIDDVPLDADQPPEWTHEFVITHPWTWTGMTLAEWIDEQKWVAMTPTSYAC